MLASDYSENALANFVLFFTLRGSEAFVLAWDEVHNLWETVE